MKEKQKVKDDLAIATSFMKEFTFNRFYHTSGNLDMSSLHAKTYLESYQTSMMELFVKTVNI